MQNLHADGLYHEPASKCNFDLNRQNTLLLNLFGTIGRKNTTLDGMYHMLLVGIFNPTSPLVELLNQNFKILNFQI